MLPIALFFHLLLRLLRELIKLALALATIPRPFWMDVAILGTSLIAAIAGVDILFRKIREFRLKLEFDIMKNPAQINRSLEQIAVKEVKEPALRCDSFELIYFRIRNRSKVTLPDNKIWIEFDDHFTILDENAVNNLPPETPLGTLQEEMKCVPLLYPEKARTFDNLIWGKGNSPTLQLLWLAFYDPDRENATTILWDDDKFIPVWVRTPKAAGKYKVTIKVKPMGINKVLHDELVLHVT
jgi:hypothetical protein